MIALIISPPARPSWADCQRQITRGACARHGAGVVLMLNMVRIAQAAGQINLPCGASRDWSRRIGYRRFRREADFRSIEAGMIYSKPVATSSGSYPKKADRFAVSPS
jgi:hypothetical protein